MYVLPIERQAQILSALVEGNSIRSTSRMSGAHQVTILSLLRRVGEGCDRMMDKMMHGLSCQRLELDEIWSYVGMKQKRAAQCPERYAEVGDFYTFVALDAETKLVPCYRVGKRTWNECDRFINDLHSRLAVRPQITTDAFPAYYGSIRRAFDSQVDYAQLTKVFASELNSGRGRYSPPVLVDSARETLIGSPDEDFISTSYVERQNLTMRMCMRRFTRLTNGFSKKVENHAHAVALYFVHYNFVRVHGTLRVTPAMAAGIADHVLSIEEIVGLLDRTTVAAA
jgi:IS1 family transposase